jgi:hypothetical protein
MPTGRIQRAGERHCKPGRCTAWVAATGMAPMLVSGEAMKATQWAKRGMLEPGPYE